MVRGADAETCGPPGRLGECSAHRQRCGTLLWRLRALDPQHATDPLGVHKVISAEGAACASWQHFHEGILLNYGRCRDMFFVPEANQCRFTLACPLQQAA